VRVGSHVSIACWNDISWSTPNVPSYRLDISHLMDSGVAIIVLQLLFSHRTCSGLVCLMEVLRTTPESAFKFPMADFPSSMTNGEISWS